MTHDKKVKRVLDLVAKILDKTLMDIPMSDEQSVSLHQNFALLAQGIKAILKFDR